jgi:hypothetical protein
MSKPLPSFQRTGRLPNPFVSLASLRLNRAGRQSEALPIGIELIGAPQAVGVEHIESPSEPVVIAVDLPATYVQALFNPRTVRVVSDADAVRRSQPADAWSPHPQAHSVPDHWRRYYRSRRQ